MGERKVLNKYYPPDFDHTIIPRSHRGRDFQMRITMMAVRSATRHVAAG